MVFTQIDRARYAVIRLGIKLAIIDVLNSNDSPFESFRGALINNTGQTIFFAKPRGQTLGIFHGFDPGTDCLLSIAGPLYGSTIADFALNPVSINDRVKLADERQFILRADPT